MELTRFEHNNLAVLVLLLAADCWLLVAGCYLLSAAAIFRGIPKPILTHFRA